MTIDMAPPRRLGNEGSRAYVSLILGATFLAFSGLFIRLSGENTATTTFYRCLLALPVLAVLSWREVRRHGGLDRRTTLIHLCCGLLLGVDFSLFAQSLALIEVGIATVVGNIQILVAPLLAALAGRGRLTRHYLIAVPVMLVGVALAGGVLDSSNAHLSLAGLMFALASGVGYGAFIFLAGTADRSQHAMLPALLNTLTCGVAGTALGSIFGGVDLSPDLEAFGWLVGIMLCGQVLALLTIGPALGRVNAAAGAALLLLTPILALAFGAVLLGEVVSLSQVVGAVLVAGGVVVATGVLQRSARASSSR